MPNEAQQEAQGQQAEGEGNNELKGVAASLDVMVEGEDDAQQTQNALPELQAAIAETRAKLTATLPNAKCIFKCIFRTSATQCRLGCLSRSAATTTKTKTYYYKQGLLFYWCCVFCDF